MATNGGKRKGAGRKKGSLAGHTLEAQELKRNLIYAYHEKADLINTALLDKAISGDVPAIKEVHDRVWGKAPQSVEMTGKDGEKLFQPSPSMVELAKMLDAMRYADNSTGSA